MRPRVALLEASHWHVPLYLDALAEGAQVVVVADTDPAAAARVAARFGAATATDWQAALEAPGLDVAFAFGRHREMPAIAQHLIDKRLPFAIEKPGGLNAAQVGDVAARAHAFGVPASVPFIQRLGPLPHLLEQIGPVRHCSFRFLAGPPSRYPRVGCGWMLDAAEAGGGCFVNLGIHFVDLFRSSMGEPVDDVVGRVNGHGPSMSVEDHAVAVLRTRDGRSAVIETGYTFPEAPAKRDIAYYASGPGGFVGVTSEGIATVTDRAGKSTRQRVEVDTDPLYGVFVRRVLETYATGFEGLPSLEDLHATMQLVDRVYAAARSGGLEQPSP